MTRLIDADALTLRSEMVLIRYGKGCLQERLAVRYEDIENAPTIDAVQVIRCKDCRYYEVYERKYDGSADKRFKPSICTRAYEYAVAKDPNWFCADAEPKEADG